MASTQRVRFEAAVTWTVVDRQYRLIDPAESYLEFLRAGDYAANTVKSYAHALALWWTFLERRNRSWLEVRLKDFGGFLQAVRTGTVSAAALPLRPAAAVCDATVAARVRPVMSLYRFHAAHGVPVAGTLYDTVRTPFAAYLPFLEHVARREGRSRSRVRVTVRRSGPAPILLPGQISGLLDREAAWDGRRDGWVGDLRYRLLWAFLSETGARLGEALSVRHGDWRTGRGDVATVDLVPRRHPHGLAHKSGGRRVHVSSRLDRLYGDFVWALCEQGADAVIDDWDSSYVFVNTRREPLLAPMRPESVYAHLRAVKRQGADLPAGMTPHWFRHTHATALLLAGTPLHVVSRRLGHRDVQTTINIYGHVTDDAELAALANWQDFTAGWGAPADGPVTT